MSITRSLLGASALIVAGSLLGCGAGVTRRKVGDVTHTLTPAQALQRVFVDCRVGSVRLVPGTGTQVRVDAEVWLDRARPDSDFVADFARHLRLQDSQGVLSLADAHSGADADAYELRVTVQVPLGLDYTVELDTGSVSIELPTIKAVKVNVGAGQATVAADEVAGVLDVELGTGQADLEVRKQGPTAGLRAELSAGQITVTLPETAAGQLSASASAGDIQIAPRLGVQVKRDYASVTANGKVGAGGPEMKLKVSTGQIVLR